MAHYVIEASHTDPECRAGLVAIGDRGMHLLHKAWFGCAAGVHTAWVELEAGTEAEALGVLPPSTRTKARVVEVQRFTRDELKVLHP